MKFFAVVLGLLALEPSVARAADWTTHTGARAEVSAASLPAVVYDPALSVEEFNRRLAQRDPQQCLLVEMRVPRKQLSLQRIVDSAVQFTCDGETYQGRVSAAFIPGGTSSSEFVLVHAQVENRLREGTWMLSDGAIGSLAIARQ